MELDEFRTMYINEDIKAEAYNSSRHEIEVFIESASDILQNDYSLITEMTDCFYEYTKGNRAYKSMHIDGGYLDLPSNTLNLLLADYNPGSQKNLTNDFLNSKFQLLLNFFENSLKKYFKDAEMSDPAVQLANDICSNVSEIYRLHLFIISTNKLSKAVKRLNAPDYTFGNYTFKVDLDVLDIEGIYKSRLASFKKDDIVINCEDFGIEGIPCIKADIDTDQYESYLAIIPGKFLSDIYKKYSSSLLESNVRSFLKFNGAVNKGIRDTILKERSRFFTYNNGISTMAKSIETKVDPQKGMMITSLVDLQIINGGQTTATLAATSIKNNADLSGIFVQMKLTVLKEDDPDLIRHIACYANSQNKVKTADLNSSHPFYVVVEDLSRKLYAPKASGSLVQQLWFFERTRGQYEQAMMQMTKKQRDDYKLIRPKDKKFTLTDLAKYENASYMLPHYVSWGGEVNAAQFHTNMLKQWEKNRSIYNESYFKELIGKKLLFAFIERVISDQLWYQERRAYRPQLVAYTFSKLVHSAKKLGKEINYRNIWDNQIVPKEFEFDIASISRMVFVCMYDDSRSTANIETYCKKEELWNIVKELPYTMSDRLVSILITKSEREVEITRSQMVDKLSEDSFDEINIFERGSLYWKKMIELGKTDSFLNSQEIETLEVAVKYCNGIYSQLSKEQLKGIYAVLAKLKENGIILNQF